MCGVEQLLPLEELYAPPINICVRDNRKFGRKPVVGVHAIKSLQSYRRTPAVSDTQLDSDQLHTTGQLYAHLHLLGISEIKLQH